MKIISAGKNQIIENIYKNIDKYVKEDYCKPNGCKKTERVTAPNGSFFCVGISNHPHVDVPPYDIICFCDVKLEITNEMGTKISNKPTFQTPDEALTIARLFIKTVERWLCDNQNNHIKTNFLYRLFLRILLLISELFIRIVEKKVITDESYIEFRHQGKIPHKILVGESTKLILREVIYTSITN